jgi:iron complex outermembrane receptor protein
VGAVEREFMTHHSRSLALMLGTILSTAPAFAADLAPSDSDRDDIVVTGERSARDASAGTKTNIPIVETPQSISVIGAEDIAGLGLQNLNQALRLVAGVTPEQRGSAAEVYDQFKLRGFDAPIYLDGLKLFSSATGYAAPQVDISRIDRIEVVKGPASVLYGQSSPGGLVAESSKLPLNRDLYGAISGTYGTYDLYRVDADIGGKLSDNVLWRVYGSANGAHQQQEFGKRRRQTASAAVTIGAGTSTTLTLLGAYSHDPLNGNYGVWPALGTFLPNSAGQISTKFYSGEPGDFFKREQAAGSYFLRHDFGNDWAFRSSGRYQYVKSSLGIVYTGGYPAIAGAAPTVFSRASYSTQEQMNAWTFDNQLTGKVKTGPLEHNLLFGFDSQVSHSDELYAFGSGTPIDVFNPVYGTMPTPMTPAQVPDPFGDYSNTHQRQRGIYVQDQISAGGLRLTLSGRQDWARQASSSGAQENNKFTWRVGGLYVTPIGLAPYASYSTSFEPQSAQLATGGLAKPSLGKQFEVGAKYQVPGTTILVTAAWFNIEQTNVVVSDPISFLASQTGKVRSRGVEMEATVPLPYGFNAKLAFSHQKVKVLEDVAAARVGRPLMGVGRGNLTANLEWSPKSGPAEGLTVGGAVRYVDKVYAGIYLDNVARSTPSYTLFDALVRYDLGKLSPQLANFQVGVNATNLFNKRYLTSCYTDYGWCWYGNRRTVQGTIGYRF